MCLHSSSSQNEILFLPHFHNEPLNEDEASPMFVVNVVSRKSLRPVYRQV